MISDSVIDALVASGATAEMIAAAVKASRGNAMTGAERQARYAAKKKALLKVVTNTDEKNVSERHSVTTKGFPLSPVPLLSPTPPNNPLTPKPLSKNSLSAWPSDGFARFYGKFPNKVGKRAALKAFEACEKRGVLFDAVLDGLDRYVRTKPPDRPWLNPATFLNQDRHEDQPAETEIVAKPLTEFQRKQQEATDYGTKLKEVADSLGGGGTIDRILPDYRGQQPGNLPDGIGATVLRLSRTSHSGGD